METHTCTCTLTTLYMHLCQKKKKFAGKVSSQKNNLLRFHEYAVVIHVSQFPMLVEI